MLSQIDSHEENKDGKNAVLNVLAIIAGFIVLFTATYFILPGFRKTGIAPAGKASSPSGKFIGCLSNMRKTALAMEKYAKDNNGKYPGSLKALTPRYIKSIPTCPGAHFDTFSSSYMVNKTHTVYTIYCRGTNHKGVGVTAPNYPQYDTINGVKDLP